LSKHFFCNITARTHKLACRLFCHLHFAASTKRTGSGWGLTSSVHVKNLAKQLCRSSNSTRGSWISKGGSDCVLSAARLVGGGSLKSSNFFGFVHLLNCFRVYYDMLSTFNKSAFLDCMEKNIIEIYWSKILFWWFCWGQLNGAIRF